MAELLQDISEASIQDDVAANNMVSEGSDGTDRNYSRQSRETTSDAVGGDGNEDDNIRRLTRVMFEKVADYLQGELSGTIDDYKLFEEMNKVTTTKYSDMKQITVNVNKALKELNEKYKSLQPYLEQVEQIEESALKLEQAAYKLDAYSKRLEAKFKMLEKR